jgi:uncharacterized LabA/DUF88 family protein
MDTRPSAAAYIDGLNLYKLRLSRNQSIRWVNLLTLIERLFPEYKIVKIHYFTAELRRTDNLSSQRLGRQKNYLRALRTLEPVLDIHLGTFRADQRQLPAVPLALNEAGDDYRRVSVLKVEEKGSDVHLASRLIADSAKKTYQRQIVVSNDSDLVSAIAIATKEFGATVDLVLPLKEERRGSNHLRQQTLNQIRTISDDALKASQFDDNLTDMQGVFHKPKSWT